MSALPKILAWMLTSILSSSIHVKKTSNSIDIVLSIPITILSKDKEYVRQ